MQQGGKVGHSAPNQAPRPKAAAAAGGKRLTRPVSPALHTSKRHRTSAPGPAQQVHNSDALPRELCQILIRQRCQ